MLYEFLVHKNDAQIFYVGRYKFFFVFLLKLVQNMEFFNSTIVTAPPVVYAPRSAPMLLAVGVTVESRLTPLCLAVPRVARTPDKMR